MMMLPQCHHGALSMKFTIRTLYFSHALQSEPMRLVCCNLLDPLDYKGFFEKKSKYVGAWMSPSRSFNEAFTFRSSFESRSTGEIGIYLWQLPLTS